MRHLINGSKFIGEDSGHTKGPIQDRYSIRCLPQFLAPIVEGIRSIIASVEKEFNSITDNPLVDVKRQRIVNNGTFLAEHIAVAMDQLRYYFSLITK